MCKERFAVRQSPTRGIIIELRSTIPTPEVAVSSGKKEGVSERHLSAGDMAESILQPHSTEEKEEEKVGMCVGGRGGTGDVAKVGSSEVVKTDAMDGSEDGQVSPSGNLPTPQNTRSEDCKSALLSQVEDMSPVISCRPPPHISEL